MSLFQMIGPIAVESYAALTILLVDTRRYHLARHKSCLHKAFHLDILFALVSVFVVPRISLDS